MPATRTLRLPLRLAFFLLLVVLLALPAACLAEVDYVTRFALDKEKFLLGEPIFCRFTIQNTGTEPFAFSYRTPGRVLNRELEQEPRFAVSQETGQLLPDPAPRPCGGAKGTVVYGSVTLPPGQLHKERWLLNEWARFPRPGRYRVRAERRIALLRLDPATREFMARPAAYALAVSELSFEVEPSTERELEAALLPYARGLKEPGTANFPEALLVVTALPRPFLLADLESLAKAPAKERRWDRRQALEGLARLGTRAAWDVILEVARGQGAGTLPPGASAESWEDNALRAYAVLLLGEKGDATFLPKLLEMVSTGPQGLRDDALRALGFFNHPRANQVLFEKLHSPNASDRVNAILGLKNLESKETVPPLLAMLNDPAAQVRQVANFALQSLTGQKFKLAPNAARPESRRVAEQWHAWWREHGASFVPVRQPPCHDW